MVDILNVALATLELWGGKLGEVEGGAVVTQAVLLGAPRQPPLHRVIRRDFDRRCYQILQ